MNLRTIKRVLAFFIVVSIAFPPQPVFAVSSSQFLVETAMKYYNMGYDLEALHELNKALLVDPGNAEAQYYIDKIEADAASGSLSREAAVAKSLDEYEPSTRTYQVALSRDEVISRQLAEYSKKPGLEAVPPTRIPSDAGREEKPAAAPLSEYVDVTGEYQVSLGVRSPDEVIWKEANADLNERNFRILWSDTRYNTYDPAIFDRLRFIVDARAPMASSDAALSAHANVTIDPWSFTGKTETFTLAGAGGDSVEMELKYWSNTGKTINEIYNTLQNGDGLAVPEIKVIDGRTQATNVTSTFSNIFSIPSQKVDMNFMPLREFWLDYKEEPYSVRFFPIGYQDQALTSDDPLNVSNHHTWWEESPWLADWKPGELNTGATPDDFTKGIWDDSLAFYTRDSDGVRLTALRGVALAYEGIDFNLNSTIASPKNLWADYESFDTYATATRMKYNLLYNLGIGLTHAGHFGFKEHELDGLNNVFSFDGKFEPIVGTKLLAQVAASESSFDRTSEEYSSRTRGQAYFVSMVNRWPTEDLYDQEYGALRRKGEESWFLKSRFRVVRMDQGFDSTLSNYSQTRDDEYWSRHISFRKHPLYIYTGLTKPMRFEDIEAFAIGDGIDSGRSVISWRLEGETKFFDRYLKGLFDVRNVHHSQTGSFIENVARLQMEYPVTDKLMTKFLGIRHNLCETTEGIDPFIYNEDLDRYVVNTAITGGQDPSLGTVSLGLEYQVNDQIAFNAVHEYTNDSNVATDNYPRGLFNDSSFTTYEENGKIYREAIPFLYSQQYFPLPPYDYFNITKFGFSYRPVPVLEFYLDFAFNEFKEAGQIDDNMNHYGLEIAYTPTTKLSFLFKYVYSRWIDMLWLNATGQKVFEGHNNFFLEGRYRMEKNAELIFDYGVGGLTPLGSATYDPFGGSLAVLDTQHIFRLYYKKRF
ncbi:MAG: hypothetical protein PHH75_01505 [Candidatus Omnitrophica bacterium]|nr:hypothetical protein [Candidatus Omnitrophota bacterium]MDD5573835.1 hypothetical protein [Candidatus Omnitrophota bacterium]